MWLRSREEGGEWEERRAVTRLGRACWCLPAWGAVGDRAFPVSEVGTMAGTKQRRDRPALTQVFTGTLLRLQESGVGGQGGRRTGEEATAPVQASNDGAQMGQWRWRSGGVWHLFWWQSQLDLLGHGPSRVKDESLGSISETRGGWRAIS